MKNLAFVAVMVALGVAFALGLRQLAASRRAARPQQPQAVAEQPPAEEEAAPQDSTELLRGEAGMSVANAVPGEVLRGGTGDSAATARRPPASRPRPAAPIDPRILRAAASVSGDRAYQKYVGENPEGAKAVRDAYYAIASIPVGPPKHSKEYRFDVPTGKLSAKELKAFRAREDAKIAARLAEEQKFYGGGGPGLKLDAGPPRPARPGETID